MLGKQEAGQGLGEMSVTGLRGVKGFKTLDPPRVREVKDQVRDKERQQMRYPRGRIRLLVSGCCLSEHGCFIVEVLHRNMSTRDVSVASHPLNFTSCVRIHETPLGLPWPHFGSFCGT